MPRLFLKSHSYLNGFFLSTSEENTIHRSHWVTPHGVVDSSRKRFCRTPAGRDSAMLRCSAGIKLFRIVILQFIEPVPVTGKKNKQEKHNLQN